ncbi:hypothetical protein [Microcoleus sp. OTE_8_concoct_300]|uniref:hypothetical protein n=1 Tax=Microcoleus sp. OTE_8_concoct_300 TaxID=2964710 RepID=UPI00403F253A
MSIPEPESPKPDESVVETPSPNFLGDLEAQSKALREELDTARQRLAVVEKQIADSAADHQQLQADLERTRAELASKCEELEKLRENQDSDYSVREVTGEIIGMLRKLKVIPKDAKLPTITFSEIGEVLSKAGRRTHEPD